MSANDDSKAPERLEQTARVDYRLLADGREPTAEDERNILSELRDYRRAHTSNHGKPITWKRLAELVGVSHSVLTETVNGTYNGSRANVLRSIDAFLADERKRSGKADVCRLADITALRRAFGALEYARMNRTIAAIVGASGSGKTTIVRAFAADHQSTGVVIIRADETSADMRGVSRMICQAIPGLNRVAPKRHHERMTAVKKWFHTHPSVMLAVDEAQELNRSGLEALRGIHDSSDPEERIRVPMALVGDERLLRYLVASRDGSERTPLSPQISRRISPLFQIDAASAGGGDDSAGQTYTVEDLQRILRQGRVRLVSDEGIRFLTRLANVAGWGSLGLAINVARLALEIGRETPVGVRDLRAALSMTLGPLAEQVDQAAQGELYAARRVG